MLFVLLQMYYCILDCLPCDLNGIVGLGVPDTAYESVDPNLIKASNNVTLTNYSVLSLFWAYQIFTIPHNTGLTSVA